MLLGNIKQHVPTLLPCYLLDLQAFSIINATYLIFSYINDSFKFLTSFLSPIPRRKMKFSTNFAATLSLVGQIKSSLNCNPSFKLNDITHAQYTYTKLFTGRISMLGMYSSQSYGCVRITSWITLVVNLACLTLSETSKSEGSFMINSELSIHITHHDKMHDYSCEAVVFGIR